MGQDRANLLSVNYVKPGYLHFLFSECKRVVRIREAWQKDLHSENAEGKHNETWGCHIGEISATEAGGYMTGK